MQLLKFSLKPIIFSPEKDLTAWYQGFGSSHNIVAHEETNTIYAVGTQRNLTCAGGLWIVDVSDPANPTSPGCVNEDGYVHDGMSAISYVKSTANLCSPMRHLPRPRQEVHRPRDLLQLQRGHLDHC
jgi:hypothetical protein